MTAIRSLTRAALALALGLASACASARPSPAPGVEERIRRVENGLLPYHVVRGEPAGHALAERMRFYKVPAVSVAVINNGRIEWARAWGETEAGSGVRADTTTLFQAASISKPVAAMAALRLVQDGRLSLDENVNGRLTSWKVPDNAFTAAESVTLRRLLSHSAGTTVHGFPGYAQGVAVPTVVQVLNGEAPANTRPVLVDTLPGSRWRYSGGGLTIVQLLMTDVTGRDFTELMREMVLEPAGMRRSTYAQPLPAARLAEAATGHLANGTPVRGKHHTYPEQAAAGLWTTPSDLARLAIDVQRAYRGERGRILSPEMARLMLTKQAGSYGLGFSLDGEADSLWFEHGGSNRGFQSFFAPLASTGQGVVVMTNGDGGSSLALEVIRAVSREYGLPGARRRERDAVRLDSATLAGYAGTYLLERAGGPAFTMTLEVRDGVLRASVPSAGWVARALRPSAADRFFFLDTPGEIAFERDVSGRPIAVNVSGVGTPARLVRQ